MKRLLKPALCLALLVCAAAALMTAPAFAEGNGTETDPYLVGTWADLQTALTNGGYVNLNGEITAASTDAALTVPAGVTVTLDLAGHTVNRALTSAAEGGNVITVNGTLTVTDSGTGGTITGGYSKYSDDGAHGGGVYVAPTGSFVLAGGAISGNRTDEEDYGGGVHVGKDWDTDVSGQFAMTGGTIRNNSAKSGGVYWDSFDPVGTFYMSGGTISGNTASGEGGGIYGWFYLNMSGNASITNNTGGTRSAVYCAGLTMSDNAGITNNHSTGSNSACVAVACNSALSLSGNAHITGNTNGNNNPANVPVSNSTKLTIAGALGSDALVGVTSWSDVSNTSPLVFTNGLSGHGTADNFTSDQGYDVALSGGGEAQLTGNTVTFYHHGETTWHVFYTEYQTVAVTVGDKVSRPTDPTDSSLHGGLTFGGWYTDSACTQEYDFDTVVTGPLELYPRWQRTLTEADVTLADGTWTYNGAAQKPAVTVTGMTSIVKQADGEFPTGTLTEGTDYTVTYADNVNAGTATVTVTGKRFNSGTITKTFTIDPAVFNITVSDMTNGSVAAPASVTVGNAETTVTLTVTPAAGYGLGTLTVTDASGKAVTVTNNQFTMPASNVTVSATFVTEWPWLSAQFDGASTDSASPTLITLSKDYTAAASDTALTVPAGRYVALDLAGHVLDRHLTDLTTDGNVIQVFGKLILTDSAPAATHSPAITYTDPITNGTVTVNGGVITGANADNIGYGAAVYVGNTGELDMQGGNIAGNHGKSGGVYVTYSGTFKMSGGTIRGNSASDSGGGVYINGGTFTLESGSIIGNSASDSGGVYVFPGTFTMSGGAVSGNSASYCGGVENNGTFTLSGGEITGNSAEQFCGGVENSGTFNLSGAPTISGNTFGDNTPGNVFLERMNGAQTVITVTGALTNTVPIGVTTETAPTAGAPVIFTDGLSGKGTAAKFTSDDSGYVAVLNANLECMLAVPLHVTLPADSARGTVRVTNVSNTPVTGEAPAYVLYNDVVTLAVTPAKGCVLAANGLRVTYTDAQNQQQAVALTRGTGENANKYTFTMPADSVLVNAVFAPVFGAPTFTLPAEIKTVGESAFEGADMTIAEIPSGCQSIGKYAFRNCASLTQIRIPASVTSIDTTAFKGCTDVLVYGAAGSAAETFCAAHANCSFVAENTSA